MADVLTYAVSVAPAVDGDVVARELSVVINGVEQSVVSFPGYALDLGEVDVPQDAQVVLRLVDIDDAGNRSDPAEVYFTAVDTLPPSVPGGLTVSLISERRVDDTPAPEVVDDTNDE